MPDKDWIYDEIGSGIADLIEGFVQMPYCFYSEQDMQSYLYSRLIAGKLGQFTVRTRFGDETILVHREYPTLKVYPGGGRGGARGHFDLAILDPAKASESHWRKEYRQPPYAGHRLKAALEFGLNALGTTRLDLAHFQKDFERLTNPENFVERGYLLFFVRRQDYLPNSGMLGLIDGFPEELGRRFEQNRGEATNLVIAYVESISRGLKRLQVIPEEKSPWIGQSVAP